jgi:hypothetical protein
MIGIGALLGCPVIMYKSPASLSDLKDSEKEVRVRVRAT